MTSPQTHEVGKGTEPDRITLDPDLYRDALSDLSLSEDQETALLQALWEIMYIFVEIGWGIDSVQQMIPRLLSENVLDTSETIAHDQNAQIGHGGATGNKEEV